MKKIIRLNEFELVSLMKRTIMEISNPEKKSNLSKLTYNSLTDSQKDKIKSLGMRIFSDIKNYIEPETNRRINYWLEQHGLQLKVPSVEFIQKNIDDIKFVFDNLELSNSKKKDLKENLDFLELQLENPNSKFIVLFHEENDEWSIVNMFDNNIILWIKLINDSFDFNSEINVDEFLNDYYKGGSDSRAAHDLLRAILLDRENHKKNIFSKTWGGGQEVENNFFNQLRQLGVSPENLRIFSGGGNFVDRAGFDGAMRCRNIWFSIQVKSNQNDALKSIPYRGISVFPSEGEFYYFHDKKVPPKPISSLVQKCI
jgi:hypothetical protein